MAEETWDINNMKARFALELEETKKYLKEKKKITPKPKSKEDKKLTTLSDRVERILLSDIETKEQVLETLSNFKINPNMWMPDIQRLNLEIAALKLRFKDCMIKNEGV